MNNKEHAKNLLDTMPIVNRSASIMNAGARSRFNSPTQMGHSPAEMGHSPAEMGHSPAEMSPLKEKNFPVRPNMKLSNFEELIDKRTGEKVGKEALNVPEGTDLSYLEGVTNLSKLGEGGMKADANISNRVNAGQYRYNKSRGYSVPLDDYARNEMQETDPPAYPRVNLNVDEGLTQYEDGSYSFDLGKNYKQKDKKLTQAKSDVKNMIKGHNVRSNQDKREGSYPNVGLPGNKRGILETDAVKPRTAANEDIYTTARLGNKTDTDYKTTTYTLEGATGYPSSEANKTYLTQRNKNMPSTFTLNSLKNRISKNPQQFYVAAGPNSTMSDRPTGNLANLSNLKDDYTHMDFTGNLQRPNDRFAQFKGSKRRRSSSDFNERD